MSYNIAICIKSGTSGYHDQGGSDLLLKELEVERVPQTGETITLHEEGGRPDKYLVMEVNTHFSIPKKNWSYGEFLTIYVISA